MPPDVLPVLDLTDAPDAFAHAIGGSFRRTGFALVGNHGIEPALIARGWDLARAFFALPESEKRRYFDPNLAGARGYTPFATEIAKGAQVHDLKEFWHVGRDLPAGHGPTAGTAANVWPDRPQGFRETFAALFAAFDRVGATILSRIATSLGLAPDWFDPAIAEGNSVLRLLHYPPVSRTDGGAIRAAPHEDINLITLLLGAEEAGLELLGRDGAWRAVDPPAGALVVNIGDMLARLTNDALPSTTHRVRNPSGDGAARSRYAMPFFLHLRGDFVIRALPRCVSTDRPDRYPDPITADAFLQERLREIGLKR